MVATSRDDFSALAFAKSKVFLGCMTTSDVNADLGHGSGAMFRIFPFAAR
jgi:hypothetical protein